MTVPTIMLTNWQKTRKESLRFREIFSALISILITLMTSATLNKIAPQSHAAQTELPCFAKQACNGCVQTAFPELQTWTSSLGNQRSSRKGQLDLCRSSSSPHRCLFLPPPLLWSNSKEFFLQKCSKLYHCPVEWKQQDSYLDTIPYQPYNSESKFWYTLVSNTANATAEQTNSSST